MEVEEVKRKEDILSLVNQDLSTRCYNTERSLQMMFPCSTRLGIQRVAFISENQVTGLNRARLELQIESGSECNLRHPLKETFQNKTRSNFFRTFIRHNYVANARLIGARRNAYVKIETSRVKFRQASPREMTRISWCY